MTSVKILRRDSHTRCLNARNIDRILFTEDFKIAYNAATLKERFEIELVVNRQDIKILKIFIKDQLAKLTPFHRMKIRQLHKVAKNCKIPGYIHLNKATIIEELENVAERFKNSRK